MLAMALETAVNQVLQMDKDSPSRVKKLEGRLLQLDLEGLGITLFFTFKYGNVRVRLDAEGEPDTIISGTPVALFSMAEPEDADWGLPDSKVHASLARDLERIFGKLEPDWEGPLAGMLGDTAGYQAAQGIRQGVELARDTARTAGKILSDLMKDRNT